ncbi:MAG TPA: hypothetical protein VM370_01030 [Candidatus Thermoplasmatota archaeon]|nr:hypothetical protein [Candidatus Thermoplasmatota archaeon]
MPRQEVVQRALVTALLACVIVFGIALRLQDPLSTRALGAEDPYTHVVFTKEWSEQGYFADSFHLGTDMYPPGMHAWLAGFVPFTGIPLHEFARIAPAFFGGLAVLGMFVLGQRLGGPAAGLAAAFLTAIMPEHIFRSELLFPTSFDLALLPLWLVAFHVACHAGERAHRVAGAALFLGMSVPLAVMHPWAVPLFAVPLAAYALLRVMRGQAERASLRWAAGMLVPAVAFALAFRWRASDTGFADFFAKLPGLSWTLGVHLPGPVLFVVLLAVLGAVAFVLVVALERAPALPRLAGIALGVALLACVPILVRAPPPSVNYPDMLGWVAIGLALAGYAVALVRPSAVGDMGIAVSAWLLPLTALNVFHSEFWPQRTVAYLTIGVALLAAALAREAAALPQRFARSQGSRATMGTVALLALALVFAGSAVAQPPHAYKWYRLYHEPEYEGFEEIAKILDQDPTSRVFVYTWQPALMVKTLSDPEHVWYGPKFFNSAGERATYLTKIEGHAYVLVDKHTRDAQAAGKADLGFLQDGRYHLVYQSEGGGVKLFEVDK